MAISREKLYKDGVKVVLLCIAWYVISSTNNVIGKKILNDFPHPITVTMIQFLSAAIYLTPALRVWNVPEHSEIPRDFYWRRIVPLGAGKLLASVSSHISISKVPVSYAHTVKALMPLFTVLLSRILTGEKQTKGVYLSLIPIMLGVVITTVTELSFNLVGLVSALTATLAFSTQNIFSKKVLRELHINHLCLLLVLSRLAALFILPLWIIVDFRNLYNDPFLGDQAGGIFWLIVVLLINGALNFLQNLVAFSVLSLVSPLSYSVCTTTKRILVISVSLILLKNPVTATNVVGMMTAILGVFLYNKAKYDANRKKHILPAYYGANSPSPTKKKTFFAGDNGTIHLHKV